MIRYAITERCSLPGDKTARRLGLLAQAQRWAEEGIDYIQLREKDLTRDELDVLSRAITDTIRATLARTKVLINVGTRVSSVKVALRTGANGVHLTSREPIYTPTRIRAMFAQEGLPTPVVSVSCHTLEEVVRARSEDADLILFGPVFGKTEAGKQVVPATGLELLNRACRTAQHVPVLALGGVNAANIQSCLDAGAKGIAAIRLFHATGQMQ